jgi:CBS domain-containing protein
MACDPQVVGPDARLADVAEAVLDPAGRPVVVVDAGRRPLGVIASRDVLAAHIAANHRIDDAPLAAGYADPRVPRRRLAHASGRS